MLHIKNITRGHIEFDYNGRTARIDGEGLLRGSGSPDYVLYAGTLRNWLPPHNAESIDKPTHQLILAELVAALRLRNMTVEIEQ